MQTVSNDSNQKVFQKISEDVSLKFLSNDELNRSFQVLANKEREILSEVIFHVAEVEKRGLHLEMGYSSLFSYMTEFIGYEASTAQRRIDAARLSYDVPSVVEDLKNGSIKLGQVEFLQKATRLAKQQRKDAGKTNSMTSAEKSQLVESIKNKSVQESQELISKALNIEVKQNPRVTVQSDGSIRHEVSYTKGQWQKIIEMRELLSHSLPSGSQWDQVFEYVADKVIAQKRPKTKSNKSSSPTSVDVVSTENQKADVVKSGSSLKPMSYEKLRAMVIARDQCCQYQNPKTNKKCGSKWKLEADHINPRWTGGEDTIENLRTYCANHNQYAYRKQAGIRRH